MLQCDYMVRLPAELSHFNFLVVFIFSQVWRYPSLKYLQPVKSDFAGCTSLWAISSEECNSKNCGVGHQKQRFFLDVSS